MNDYCLIKKMAKTDKDGVRGKGQTVQAWGGPQSISHTSKQKEKKKQVENKREKQQQKKQNHGTRKHIK